MDTNLQPTDVAARPGVTIVTSENRENFMADRLRLEPAAAPAAEEPKKDEPAKADAKPEEKKEDKPAPKKAEPTKEQKQQALNERFSEMAEKRKAAEALAEKEKAAREAAERERDELRAKLTPPKPEEPKDAPPKRDAFASDEEYLDALTEHRVQKALAERDRKAYEDQQKRQAEQRTEAWQKRVAELKAETPDYDERLATSTVRVSVEAGQAIMDSDVGPRIILFLADNPEEAERIGKLNVAGMLKAIGRIEAKIEADLAAKKTPEKKEPEAKQTFERKAEISKAPEPISPIKGGNATADVPVGADGEFKGDFKQFRALRQQGKL